MLDMKRREFITLLGGAVAWPLAARAQQSERMRRVGVLMFGAADDREATAIIAAFVQGLKTIGLGFRPKGQNQCSPRWEQRDNSESDTRQGGPISQDVPPVTAPRTETTRATAIRAREPAGSSAIPRMTCHRCTG